MSDTVIVEIEKVANGGFSLGRHNRRVTFVPYVLPGERVRARHTQVEKSFAKARPVEVLRAAPDRVEAPCPHYGVCGGCHWQHAAYQAQLDLKRETVLDQFERIGKFTDTPTAETIPAPEPWGYRRSATFQVLPGGAFGYYSDDNSHIVELATCPIVHPAILEVLTLFEPDDDTISRLKVQVGSDPADVMLIIETGDDLPPAIEVDLPVSVNFLLSDNEPVNLIGRSHVVYEVFDRRFRVTAGGFFQVNLEVAHILVEEVLHRLDLRGGETILELFSGVGLLTGFIAPHCDLVVSVESYPPAVTDADENLADLDNVDLVEGPVEQVLDDLDGPFDALVLDPPRAGLSKDALGGVLRLRPPKIIYVSCDPVTLARDCRALVDDGYHLVEVQPLDMFPQTYHVECIATLVL